jgi:uncharacterized protein (TIGR03435 family)
MSTLALFLARFTRMTVLDLTELKGAFEVNLEWVPENLGAARSSDIAAPGDAAGPSLLLRTSGTARTKAGIA